MISGVLCENKLSFIKDGWSQIFYITVRSPIYAVKIIKIITLSCQKGFVGIILAVFWFILVSNTPSTNRFISGQEREYIVAKTADISLSQKEKKVFIFACRIYLIRKFTI